jgi:hypothetical protein
MNSNEVRKGIETAKLNEKGSSVLFAEVFIISVGLGIWQESWWIFGICLIGLLIGVCIKPLAVFITIGLTILWGFIGYGIGTYFNSTGASIVLTILALLLSGGLHMNALEWMQDIRNSDSSK